MKHYIGQLLLGTLVLGSACTNHREIIEGDTSVNVTFKAQQSPSTKGGDDDEMSVLIFKKKRTNLPKQKVSKRVHGLPRKNTCKKTSYCQQESIDSCWQKDFLKMR